MSSTSILLISPSEDFYESILKMLYDKWEVKYKIEWIKNLEGYIPASHIALLDTDALPDNAIAYLAKSSFQLSPRPLILLVNEEPENETEFRTVKSLTSDYLPKESLNSSGLHNTIRYALETNLLKNQLEQQQKRFSSLFYNSVVPAFFLDEELTITGVNEAFLKAFKISKRQALDKSFEGFIESDSQKKKFGNSVATLATGSFEQKARFSTPQTDHTFPGRLKLTPIREPVLQNEIMVEKTTAWHGSLVNVSHIDRLKAVKEKSEKIDMTYRLARTMAHEIRNPLTNVNLAVDQLKAETAGIDDFDMYFDIIERCTQRIDGILSKLLSSSEKQVFKRSKFDVMFLLKEVIRAVRDRSALEGVGIKTEFTIKEAYLEGDIEKLRIAFTNLFTNAIESMDKAKRVINCRVRLDAHYVCIEVEDNGSGMDQRQLESLFDPFFTSKASGVGLGLTSTQTIISEHGGQIDVESEEGMGSIFSVYLPIDQ